MIGKVSLLAYKLDISIYIKIHFVISVVYLSRYRTYKDPYYYVPLSLGPVECGSDSETLTDKARDSQYWELERIVDHRTKCDRSVKYLVRWKGYGLQEDSWKDVQ